MGQRLYIPQTYEQDGVLCLSDAQAHYLTRVLRLKEQTLLEVFNGMGQKAQGLLHIQGKKDVQLLLTQVEQAPQYRTYPVTLVQAISRGERMDYTLQKATELGVQAILPVFSDFGQVKLKDEADQQKRQHHYQEIVIHAAQQSRRYDVPQILPMQNLATFLSSFQGLGWMLDPYAADSFGSVAPPHVPIHLLIGAEGGLSPNEVLLAKAVGFQGLRLGPRILRTETAAPVALSLIQCRWGDLC